MTICLKRGESEVSEPTKDSISVWACVELELSTEKASSPSTKSPQLSGAGSLSFLRTVWKYGYWSSCKHLILFCGGDRVGSRAVCVIWFPAWRYKWVWLIRFWRRWGRIRFGSILFALWYWIDWRDLNLVWWEVLIDWWLLFIMATLPSEGISDESLVEQCWAIEYPYRSFCVIVLRVADEVAFYEVGDGGHFFYVWYISCSLSSVGVFYSEAFHFPW